MLFRKQNISFVEESRSFSTSNRCLKDDKNNLKEENLKALTALEELLKEETKRYEKSYKESNSFFDKYMLKYFRMRERHVCFVLLRLKEKVELGEEMNTVEKHCLTVVNNLQETQTMKQNKDKLKSEENIEKKNQTIKDVNESAKKNNSKSAEEDNNIFSIQFSIQPLMIFGGK